MKRVSINGQSYAVPFAKLFRDLTDSELAELRESIHNHGVVNPLFLYTSPVYGRALIDGANRAAQVEARNDTPTLNMGELDDESARQLAIALNHARRHLSVAEQIEARKARLARIAEHRQAGRSFRQIATLENIAVGQVMRDVEEIRSGKSTVPGGTVDPEMVVGDDGKERLARKPPPEPEIPTDELPGIDLTVDPTRIDAAELRYLQEALDGIDEAVTVLMDLKGPRAERLRLVAKKAKIPLSKTGWPILDTVRAVVTSAAS